MPPFPSDISGASRLPKRIETIARGILVSGGMVLLCRDKQGSYAFLPGGHVEPGESAREALSRELQEEAGLERVKVGSCALVTEQRFTQNGKPRHEISLVFHVEHAILPDGTPLSLGATNGPARDVPSLESHIEFVWVEVAALSEIDLRPLSMKAWLMSADGQAGLERPAWISQIDN